VGCAGQGGSQGPEAESPAGGEASCPEGTRSRSKKEGSGQDSGQACAKEKGRDYGFGQAGTTGRETRCSSRGGARGSGGSACDESFEEGGNQHG